MAGVVLALLVLGSLGHFVHGVREAARYGFVDFPIFLAQARQFVEGGELYPDAADPGRYDPAAAVYKFPPLYGTLLLPLVGGGDGVYRGHWALQIGLYVLAAGLLAIAGGPARGLRFAAVVAIVALNFEPFFETLWRLQLEGPLLLLVVAALALDRRGRDAAAGAALGLAAMLKVYPAFLLGPYLVRRRWRGLGGAALAAGLVAVATWIVLGAEANRVWYLEVFPRLLAEAPTATPENVGLARYLMDWGGLGVVGARAVVRGVAVAATLGALALVHRARGAREPAPVVGDAVALFVPLMLLVLPNSWVNYQLLLLVPVVVLLHRACTDPGLRFPLAVAVAAAWGLLLFYQPCAEPTVPWPCARTPAFLGIAPLPRALHDRMVDLRGLAPVLLAAGAALALARRGSRSGA